MSFDERQRLGDNIHKLSPTNLKGIIQIIQETNTGKRNNKTFEFDLNVLDDQKCRQLEDYVNACLAKQKNDEIQAQRSMLQLQEK